MSNCTHEWSVARSEYDGRECRLCGIWELTDLSRQKFIRVKNATDTTIHKGEVLYCDKTHRARRSKPAERIFCIALEQIEPGQKGRALKSGRAVLP